MNTIARVRAPFSVPDAVDRQRSVTTAMRALLDADIRADDRRGLLDVCLWRYTGFENKYKFATRYRSSQVLAATPVEINHDHVVERRWLLDRITANPASLEQHLVLAVACIVSRQEHLQLTGGGGFGWQRYVAAGITVIDTTTMKALNLEPLIAAQERILQQLGETVPAVSTGLSLLEDSTPIETLQLADQRFKTEPGQAKAPPGLR